jgi:cation diffusion facilitator CzcD-associated flavoprotein CzcO
LTVSFPASWPAYTPALKVCSNPELFAKAVIKPFHQLADWLESYAHSLELNVWTSSTVVKASQDPSSHHWSVTVKCADGRERILHPHHLVFALGFGGGLPNIPKYPGMNEFGGQTLHSSQHNKATDHAGKKVVVVGSCTSGN